VTLATDTLDITDVDPDKSFLIATYETNAGVDRFNDRHPIVSLDAAGENIEFFRQDASSTVYVEPQIVIFAPGGDENVLRGNYYQATSDGDDDITLPTPVTNLSSSVPWTPTPGTYSNGALPGDESSDVGDRMGAFDLTAVDTLILKHETFGDENDQYWDWEVIEWDTSGAPPATRRVMVIS
jgi:hypothetical protein